MRIEKESIFILPENYIGTVLVVYDVPNSTKPEYDSEGRRVYRIPSNGILETEDKATYHISNMPKFYRKEKNSRTTELSYITSDWENSKLRGQIVVSTMETGKNKKDYLSFIISEFDNDTIGSRRYVDRLRYFEKW